MPIDSPTPISTCIAGRCEGCDAFSHVHCNFTLRQTIHFWLIAAPPILLGGLGAYDLGWAWLVPGLVLIIGFFGFLEIRVMCSHCPHYAESGSTLTCWANYGSPKPWAFRPGPMSTAEHALFIGGLAVVYGYPLVCLAASGRWFLLLVCAMSTLGFYLTLRTWFCSCCMNFACTLNTVDDEVRRAFFRKNPGIAEAWPAAETSDPSPPEIPPGQDNTQ